jgi:hypothetical protein
MDVGGVSGQQHAASPVRAGQPGAEAGHPAQQVRAGTRRCVELDVGAEHAVKARAQFLERHRLIFAGG